MASNDAKFRVQIKNHGNRSKLRPYSNNLLPRLPGTNPRSNKTKAAVDSRRKHQKRSLGNKLLEDHFHELRDFIVHNISGLLLISQLGILIFKSKKVAKSIFGNLF